MQGASRLPVMLATALPLVIAVAMGARMVSMDIVQFSRTEPPRTIEIAPRAFTYRMAGDFSRNGQPVDAPLRTIARNSALTIMRNQVSAAEFARCVAQRQCPPRESPASEASDAPVVDVNWYDATAYAAWLSAKTGDTWRLPMDEEWAFAAGSRFHDDAVGVSKPGDPSARWLARYENESAQFADDKNPRPAGAFGPNEYGVVDLAGNVWEWTNTCLARHELDTDDRLKGIASVNCGGRVVAGRHRAYIPDFIRDARSGGCAVGKPPSNLGFRLVRE